MRLKIGDKAPEFETLDQNEKKVKLSDFREKKVVLYFYPKDNTPGCTIEACSFRDDIQMFDKIKAKIIGVSIDDITSHKKFVEKYKLNFTLLVDDKKEISQKYGVLNIFGKAGRTTFLINEKGIIRHIFEKVNPEGHVKEVLGVLGKE